MGDKPKTAINKRTTPKHTFYLPDSLPQTNSNTLLVVIDPHGDGKLAYQQFAPFIKEFGMHVIGLTGVHNNDQQFLQHIQLAIDEYKTNHKLHQPKIYLAGFSGGARMALHYGLSNNADGVIMCGAGTGQMAISKCPLPVAIICGFYDFNFAECFYPPFSTAYYSRNVISFYFKGMHEWPPQQLRHDALAFISKKNIHIIDNKIFKNTKTNCEDDIVAFKIDEFAMKCVPNYITLNIAPINCFDPLQDILSTEQQRNQQFIQMIQQSSSAQVNINIDSLFELSRKSDNVLDASSYKRTLAYLGIAMYSLTAQSLHVQANQTTAVYLDIYEKLEPENRDMFFFRAVYNLQRKEFDSCKINLSKALQNGWTDKEKIKLQFPENIWHSVLN